MKQLPEDVMQLIRTLHDRTTQSHNKSAYDKHPLLLWRQLLKGQDIRKRSDAIALESLLLGLLGLTPKNDGNLLGKNKNKFYAELPRYFNRDAYYWYNEKNARLTEFIEGSRHFTKGKITALTGPVYRSNNKIAIEVVPKRSFSSNHIDKMFAHARSMYSLRIRPVERPLKSVGVVYETTFKPASVDNASSNHHRLIQVHDVITTAILYITYLTSGLFMHSGFHSVNMLTEQLARSTSEKEKQFITNTLDTAIEHSMIFMPVVFSMFGNAMDKRTYGIRACTDSNAILRYLQASWKPARAPSAKFYKQVVAGELPQRMVSQYRPNTEEFPSETVMPGMFFMNLLNEAYSAYAFDSEKALIFQFPGLYADAQYLNGLKTMAKINPFTRQVPAYLLNTVEFTGKRELLNLYDVKSQYPKTQLPREYESGLSRYTYSTKAVDMVLTKAIYGTVAANLQATGLFLPHNIRKNEWIDSVFSEIASLAARKTPYAATVSDGRMSYASNAMEDVHELFGIWKQDIESGNGYSAKALEYIYTHGIKLQVGVGVEVVDIGQDVDSVAVIPYYTIEVVAQTKEFKRWQRPYMGGIRIPLGLTVIQTEGTWL